jgi:glycosyltransferase involved in cell wall biosynthesis
MHTVSIVSAFRDSEVWSYRDRINALDYPPECLRLICVEGDSRDDTWARLQTWALQDERVILIKCDTGKPRYGSVIHAERFAILAQVFNAGMNAVDLEWSDYVLFVPSDIRFEPDLLKRLVAHDKDLIAPLTWTGDRFYDIWALSQNDCFFHGFSHAEAERRFDGKLTEMTTIGGTMLIKADVLRAGVRYTPDEVDRGFSKWARRLGFHAYLDPSTHVEHP